ncbi:MAG: hypothetical protein VX496_07705 [Planctomycetota bacterium]|nr:hypothetical protein [Planctomycetota bacterium]
MATNNEEIIERKEGSPVATSCLIIATVAILGAIALQIAELAQIRTEYHPGEKMANEVGRATGDERAIVATVKDIIDSSKPISDDASLKRAKDAGERAGQIKEDAKAEASPNKDPGDEPEEEEAPEEPAVDPAEAEEVPEEPAVDPAEAEEAPEEPAAEEDADEPGDSLEDL